MSIACIIRWSGIAFLMGGVIVSLGGALHPDGASAITINHFEWWTQFHLLVAIAYVLLLLGVTGVYATQAQKAGVFGLIAFLIVFVGVAFSSSFAVVEATMYPLIAANDPALLGANGSPFTIPALAPVVAVTGIVYLLGYVLFAISSLRARVLPRTCGWSLLISQCLFVGVGVIVSRVQACHCTADALYWGLALTWGLASSIGHIVTGSVLWSGAVGPSRAAQLETT